MLSVPSLPAPPHSANAIKRCEAAYPPGALRIRSFYIPLAGATDGQAADELDNDGGAATRRLRRLCAIL